MGFLLVSALGGGYWYWARERHEVSPSPAIPSPTDAGKELGQLTDALVDSQIELAEKNLEDKNWAEARAQAERALSLRPESAKALDIRDRATRKAAELEAAASRARRALEAGDEQEAAQALDRVIQLDPNHPVVNDLKARLNSTFRSQAEEAGRLAQRARSEAERAKAAGLDLFAQAVALDVEGDALFKKSEFANASQRYAETRDGFDRARRSVLAGAKVPPGPAGATPTADERASSASPGGTAGSPSSSPNPVEASPATSLPVRSFVTGKSVVASGRSGGGLAGFDSAKTRKMPDLAGRLEFEIEPGAPGAGEEWSLRVYLVNEGKKAVHLRGVALTVTTDGKRSSLGSTVREHDVTPQMRALVAEARGTWPTGVTSWSLEAVASSDRDETCTSRLTWQ
jgi:hypothetical protein